MKRILSLSLAMLLASPAFAAETVRYVAMVDGGKSAGHQIVTTDDDGLTHVDYVFKDNGRGPELKETFRLAGDGTFTSYHVQGNTTLGSSVDESFGRDGDRAWWKSTSDHGEQAVTGTALYTPLNGTPASDGVALAALARHADGKLPLIPSGTLSMRKLAEMDLGQGQQTRKVQLLAVTGVGLTPRFLWATVDANPRLFALIYPGWMQLIEEPWKASAAQLEARQTQAEVDLLADLQQQLAHPLAGTTLIRNARVFDSEKATLGVPSDVLLRDGRIVSVSAAGAVANDASSTPDHQIDAAGRVLMPGLFDMHGHVDRWSGGLNIAAGVTTVRDMGNDNATLQKIIAEEKAGSLLSTRIVPAGFIEGESPMSARNGFVIKTLDEAKRAVDWYAANGYVQVKIYNSFPSGILRETTAYAHAKGLRVSGHVPATMRAQDVVEQGYDEIQHINQVLLNFLVDEKTDTRTLQRFYLPAEKIADLDFDSKPVQDFIALLASRKTVIDPTLTTFDFIRQRAGQLSPAYASISTHMPPDVQRGFRSAQMEIANEATAARYERSYEKMVEFVGRMHRAGVPIVAGTDELAGFTLHRELELYVQAGMTPGEALQTATWNAATYSRALDDRGTVTPGKRADLILIDGDPTRDIADIRKVALVVKGETAYYPSEIHQAIGIRPFAEPVRATAR